MRSAGLREGFPSCRLAESTAAARRRELGIRAALGATTRQLGTLVVSGTVRLVVLGLAVGLTLVWAVSDLIGAFLFRVEPGDPLTLAVVSAAMLLLMLAVGLKPALRASRVDLAAVLREE